MRALLLVLELFPYRRGERERERVNQVENDTVCLANIHILHMQIGIKCREGERGAITIYTTHKARRTRAVFIVCMCALAKLLKYAWHLSKRQLLSTGSNA